jgi:hypothetical protein
VHCLLDLSIEGRLFDYLGIICKAADIELAMTYLSASLTAADYEVTYIRITHSRFTYLKTLLASNLRSVRQDERDGDVASMHMYRDYADT